MCLAPLPQRCAVAPGTTSQIRHKTNLDVLLARKCFFQSHALVYISSMLDLSLYVYVYWVWHDVIVNCSNCLSRPGTNRRTIRFLNGIRMTGTKQKIFLPVARVMGTSIRHLLHACRRKLGTWPRTIEASWKLRGEINRAKRRKANLPRGWEPAMPSLPICLFCMSQLLCLYSSVD